MKKFVVAWYNGSIDKIDTVIKVKEVEAEDIKDVVGTKEILPEDVLKDTYYVRRILHSSKKHILDYGSHSKFIEIREV